jgi:hypothetical protein
VELKYHYIAQLPLPLNETLDPETQRSQDAELLYLSALIEQAAGPGVVPAAEAEVERLRDLLAAETAEARRMMALSGKLHDSHEAALARITILTDRAESAEARCEELANAHREILFQHCHDTIKPKAFYISDKALSTRNDEGKGE